MLGTISDLLRYTGRFCKQWRLFGDWESFRDYPAGAMPTRAGWNTDGDKNSNGTATNQQDRSEAARQERGSKTAKQPRDSNEAEIWDSKTQHQSIKQQNRRKLFEQYP
jgi:hypothetical protein